MKYHFKVHKEKNGYWAECLELKGCLTQGDTLRELHENMQEALNLYLEEPENSKEIIPLPDKKIKVTKSIVSVPVDVQVAFSFLVRHYRLQHGLTQKQAAKSMGFETLYSYQRLEAKSCNPSLKTLCLVKQVYPEFSLDETINIC